MVCYTVGMSEIFNWIKPFFKDKNDKWAIIAFPNVLLTAWLVATILNMFIHDGKVHSDLSLLGGAILFAWAYLELTQGASYFRRLLGAIILLAVIMGYFVPR
ncbi:MAG: hypothetical protein JWO61_234 [Candidatus Saccharibacteria bacterium]|nr:hypothetical protein [Candidatus Saccharibacteria bacterium]